MLRFLDVRHLAVIDRLTVEFDAGLNVLTGETGAGKSVLIEAIGLLLGERASADLVRSGADQAWIQAVFERDGREVIVRRELSAQGRSRAFIDDALATTAALRELGAGLVDLHGQHEHHSLLDPSTHGRWLDAYLRRPDDLAAVAEAFGTWQQARAVLERSQLDDREKQLRVEMAQYHLHEIDQVDPSAGEDRVLEAERSVLQQADRLTRLAGEAYAALYDDEHAALTALAGVWKRVGDLAALDPRFEPYLEGRDALKSALEDLSLFLRDYLEDLDASPARLQAVEDRLAVLQRLTRKHGGDLDAVIARRAALRQELDELGAGQARVAELEAAESAARRAFEQRATALSTLRIAAARELSGSLARALAELAMPRSVVDIRVEPAASPSAWSATGLDRIEIYLSPNLGEELRPLARIASGGELSRVMLALHVLSSVGAAGRTMIFDEVDAGIGGAAADAVGARLQQLGARYQVLCITHLPQIAARADAHYVVSKAVTGERTATTVARLDPAGREQEIARMIAGAEVSAQARASARELLGRAMRGESEQMTNGESRGRAKAKGRSRGA